MSESRCAVLAIRGPQEAAAAAIEHANARLADFQKVRRWVLWPEPDMPRTPTGKVRRKAVAAWLEGIQAAAAKPWTRGTDSAGNGSFGARSDWLLALIEQITGEGPPGVGDELRLEEDLHLDSLGRVQVAAALEERLGSTAGSALLDDIETLGQLRELAAGERKRERASRRPARFVPGNGTVRDIHGATSPNGSGTAEFQVTGPGLPVAESEAHIGAGRQPYPLWPWSMPFRWLRSAFVEAVMRPLVWLLAHPRVAAAELPPGAAPMLIVANHVTAFDGPLIEYALPGPVRRKMAVAMSAEMLKDFRHFRNPENGWFSLFGPLAWLLLTALFNVFPLARRRDFLASFAHAGKAMDRGFNVLVFPEGTRSAAGELAPFRGGIGVLARQSGAPVLPVAIRGLGELKTGQRRWFRSGTVEVRIGHPVRFAPEETEAGIALRLRAEVEKLLND